MEVFILSKLFGNSSKSHFKVVGDFRDLYHNLWARMVVFIWGVVGYYLFLLISQLLCFRADFTVGVNQSWYC